MPGVSKCLTRAVAPPGICLILPVLALTEGARRATGVRAKTVSPPILPRLIPRCLTARSSLKWRLRFAPFRIEHVFKRKALRRPARSQHDLKLRLIGTQTIQPHNLGQPAFHPPPPFVMTALGLVANLQRPLESGIAIITQKDVHRLLPLA